MRINNIVLDNPNNIISKDFLVDGKAFITILKEKKRGDSLEITIGDEGINNMGVNLNDCNIVIPISYDTDNYPVIDNSFTKNDYTFLFSLSSNILLDIIDKVLFAVSKDEMRLTLCGICFRYTFLEKDDKSIEKKFQICSTDGHRLACFTLNNDNISNNEFNVIIASNTLALLQEDLKKNKGNIEVSFYKDKERKLQVFYDNTKIISKLIEGYYPLFEQVVPNYMNPEYFCYRIRSQEISELCKKILSILKIAPSKHVFIDFKRGVVYTYDKTTHGYNVLINNINGRIVEEKNSDNMNCYFQLLMPVECPVIENHTHLTGINAQYLKDAVDRFIKEDFIDLYINRCVNETHAIVIKKSNYV